MDIITKLKDILMSLYSKKPFRIIFALIFLAFIIKNYSSVPKNIKTNENLTNIFSINKIKDRVEKETFLKQKKQEKIKQQNALSKNEQKLINPDTDISKILNDVSKTASLKNTTKSIKTEKIKSKKVANEGDLVIVEMVIFDGKTNNTISKINEMPILMNNDEKNVFAKYVKNKKVGFSTIIPITDIMPMSKEVPTVNIAYRMTIKSIKYVGNAK